MPKVLTISILEIYFQFYIIIILFNNILDKAVLSSHAEKEYDKEGSIWKKPVEAEVEKTRYFATFSI